MKTYFRMMNQAGLSLLLTAGLLAGLLIVEEPTVAIAADPQADLSIVMSDAPDPILAGEIVIYTVTVTNNGPDTAEGVYVRDTVPDLIYLNASTSKGSCDIYVYGFPYEECQVGSMAPGEVATLTFRIRPSATSGTINNSARVYPATIDPNTGNNWVEESTTVALPDNTPPDTFIDSAPASISSNTAAVFMFSGADDTTPTETLVFECSLDGGSFSVCAGPTSYSSLADGDHIFAVRAVDVAGNRDPSPPTYTWVVDTTPPTINPVVSPNPVMLNGSAAITSGAVDALSGLTTQSCDALDTGSVGVKTVNCYAVDRAGNSNSASVLYSVVYDFTGFFSPVDNLPTINLVNAGRAIPVKFNLDGNQGLDIFSEGYPRSEHVPCNSSAPMDSIEVLLTAGSSSLSYDLFSNQYLFVWKTDKSWAGTCRQLVLKFRDGTYHRATFRFK